MQLWDVDAHKLVRRMRSHNSRVTSLAWNTVTGLLSSGAQSGHVHNYDARIAQFHTQSLKSHSMDVCGLKWSPNGRFLASGGNDNLVNVWDTYSRDPWSCPAHTFKQHTAAVKALAWCPWKPSLLASGGGSADKHIRLWNACNGRMEAEINTESQVSIVFICIYNKIHYITSFIPGEWFAVVVQPSRAYFISRCPPQPACRLEGSLLSRRQLLTGGRACRP